MKPYKRTSRVEGTIQRNLAQIIQHDFRDSRLKGLITLSRVVVSRDLSHAKVYFTVFNDDPDETKEILNSSAAFLRSLLAKTLTTRIVPSLHFTYDSSVEYGQKLSRLIDQVNEKDGKEKS